MRLQVDQAVYDVNAGFLHSRRPCDVAALVEARLQLDENGDLFPALRGFDQAIDDGGVSTNAVQRDLDGRDVRILDGGVEECFDGRERVERMVDELIAVLDALEYRLALQIAPDRARDDRCVLELGPRQTRQRKPVGESQARGCWRDHRLLQLEIFDQQIQEPLGHRDIGLQQRDRTMSQRLQAAIHRLHQILRVFLAQDDVGITDDAEEVRGADDQAGEEFGESLENHVFQKGQRDARASGVGRRDRDESRKNVRHFHARELRDALILDGDREAVAPI